MENETLELHRVSKAPPTIYYFPEFISAEEEEYLMKNVYTAPKPKWTQLSNRRLQNWGGLPHPKGMVEEPLPQWLEAYAKKIADLGVFEEKIPNHVLVNEYLPGQGIMPHEDGPLFYPTVSTINLGSHTLLDFYYHIDKESECQEDSKCDNVGPHPMATSLDDRHFLSLLLEPRSLVLVRDDMYKVHLHGIAEKTEDILTEKVANLNEHSTFKVGDTLHRSNRISLTIRYFPKVLKAKLLFGKR